MGHAHLSRRQLAAATDTRMKYIVSSVLTAIFLATVAGIVALWPDSSALQQIRSSFSQNAPGVTYESARIDSIENVCGGQSTTTNAFACVTIGVTMMTGEDEGSTQSIEVVGPGAEAGLRAGDHVTVMRTPIPGSVAYSFTGVQRGPVTIVFAVAFVLIVLAVARLKGVMALVGLGFSLAVIVGFMLPALAVGKPGALVGIVSGMAMVFVVIYVAHGFSMRSSAALSGTILGLAVSTGLGAIAVWTGRLSGIAEESQMSLSAYVPGLNFRELLVASMVLAGLGVLNDVTITQASAVWELRAAAPAMTRGELFASGMRIGRDHIASTIYTIVFAYAGTALSTLMLIALFYDRPISELITTEDLGTEVLRTLASAIGLVLSVPITTGLSALMVSGPTSDAT